MAIDLMREKAIYDVVNDVVTPVKELNHSDTEPIFRANGYQLKFDRDNTDILDIAYNSLPSTFGDLSFDIGVSDLSSPANLNYIYYLGYNGANTIHLRWSEIAEQIVFRFYKGGVLFVNYSLSNFTNNEGVFRLDVGKLYLNELEIYDASSVNGESLQYLSDIPSTSITLFGFNNSDVLSGILNKLSINQEQFLLEESTGNTITGSEGTIGTINTSHASGLEYIDSTMWEKKSFALAFDSGNSEYIDVNNLTPSWDNVLDIDFSISLNITDNSQLSVCLSIYNPLKTSFIRIIFSLSGGSSIINQVVIRIADNGTNVFPEVTTITTLPTGEFTLSMLNGELSIDGTTIWTATSTALTGFSTNDFIYRWAYSLFDTQALSADVFKATFNNTTYSLTEGLGNQVYGSDGTIGTIYTSHASGIEHINYGQWLKNGNVLKLESDNSDYVDFGGIGLEKGEYLEVVVDSGTRDVERIVCGDDNSSNFFTLYSTSIQVRINGVTESFSNADKGILTIRLFRGVGGDNSMSVNGGTSTALTTLPDYGFPLTYLAQRFGNFWSLTFYSVEINQEQFNFREGQGTTTTSESGNTTATINTSHASGTNYINSQVWNVETSKWIDYE